MRQRIHQLVYGSMILAAFLCLVLSATTASEAGDRCKTWGAFACPYPPIDVYRATPSN